MLAMRALVLAATACSAAGFAGAPSALPSMTPAKAMQGAFRRGNVVLPVSARAQSVCTFAPARSLTPARLPACTPHVYPCSPCPANAGG